MQLQDTKSTYKNQLHFHTLTANYLNRTKGNNPLHNAIKTIKYLGRNLTKEVKDWYAENSKTLTKETEETTNEWKDILCSWPGIIYTA